MTFDRKAVGDFEHTGWHRAVAHYTATFARATASLVPIIAILTSGVRGSA
jgi:hypothetical protein